MTFDHNLVADNIKKRILGSISSMFYEQLLRAQIPKGHKDSLCSQQCRFTLLGPTSIKAVRGMLMKLTPVSIKFLPDCLILRVL
jgi:hypothetical protein